MSDQRLEAWQAMRSAEIELEHARYAFNAALADLNAKRINLKLAMGGVCHVCYRPLNMTLKKFGETICGACKFELWEKNRAKRP
jgi:hypothetical protein